MQIAALLGSLNFVVVAVHTLIVNRTLLPPEVRPPAWRQGALVAMALFFGFLSLVGILYRVFGHRF